MKYVLTSIGCFFALGFALYGISVIVATKEALPNQPKNGAKSNNKVIGSDVQPDSGAKKNQDPSQVSESTEKKIATFRRLLSDPDDVIRVKGISGLGEMGADAVEATDDLVALLEKDKVPAVRLASVNALCMITYHIGPKYADKRVINALIKALQRDEDSVVRWSVCKSFVILGRDAAGAAGPALWEAMKDKDDSQLRELARRAFSEVVGPECKELVPVLLDIYKNGIEDSSTEGLVLIALARIGESEDIVVPLLIAVLKDKEPKHVRSRARAAMALGYLGPKAKAAVPHLLEALEESLKLKEAVPHLVGETLILKEDDPRNIRLTVVKALWQIGPDAKMAVPLLSSIANNPAIDRTTREVLIRDYAQRALRAITKGSQD